MKDFTYRTQWHRTQWPGYRAQCIKNCGFNQIPKNCLPGDLIKLTRHPGFKVEDLRSYDKWNSGLVEHTFNVFDSEVMLVVSIALDHHDFLEDLLVLCNNGRLGWINSQNIERLL